MVAIVIPYYKITFFEETLQSIANQTDRRFKVFIGDDASPENPVILLERFKGKFDFAYHRFETNLGGVSLTKQWDRCIALSGNEKWIMILGDDDVLGENIVESFYENLAEITNEEISVVRFATQKKSKESEGISVIYKHPKLESAIDFFFRKTRSSLSEYVFFKEKLIEVGFRDFPLAWCSDVLAVLEFSNFKKVYSINDAQVDIRITNLSISGNQENTKLKDKAIFEFYRYLLTQKSSHFSSVQTIMLLKKIEKSYLNNKKEVLLFLKISKIYFSNGFVMEYLRFIKSIFLNSLKGICKKCE